MRTASTSGTAPVWTGTTKNGTESVGSKCTDWTVSASGERTGGHTQGGPASWTQDQNTDCVGSRRLRCFMVDRTANLAPPPASGNIAFATLAGFTPGGAGLVAADELCANEASGGGPSGHLQSVDGDQHSVRGVALHPRRRLRPARRHSDRLGREITAGGHHPERHLADRQRHVLNSASEAAWTGASTPGPSARSTSTCDDWTLTTSLQGTFGFATYAMRPGGTSAPATATSDCTSTASRSSGAFFDGWVVGSVSDPRPIAVPAGLSAGTGSPYAPVEPIPATQRRGP